MAEKILRYLILGSIGLVLLVFAAVLVVDDELVRGTAGSAAEPFIEAKHDAINAVVDKGESFIYWVSTTVHNVMNFSPANRVPRVVMRVPPPIEPATPNAPEVAPADTMQPMAANEPSPPMPAQEAAAPGVAHDAP